MTETPDDLAARGRAIFERLRDLAEDPDDAPAGDREPAEESERATEAEPEIEDRPDAAAPVATGGEGSGDPDQASSAAADQPAGPAPDPTPSPSAADEVTDERPSVLSDDGGGSARAEPDRRSFPGVEDLADLAPPPPAEPSSEPGAAVEAAAQAAEAVVPDASPTSALDDVPAVEGTAGFSRDLPRVMAIANQKGGVGKTTTAVNLSACLAELGYRVLVVDLDPQGNATTGLGVNPRNLQLSMYDVLLGDRPLDDCVEPTSVRGLFIAPSSLDLAGAEIELVPVFSREMKLRRALEAVRDDYDFVLIDCPPSLGLLTVNGLAAASEVVVPIQCEYYALEGLGQLLRNVTMVQQNLNPDLELAAIILVMFDARTRLSGEVVREVRAHFGAKVCRNVVPRTVRLSEAPSFGQPIISFDPSSRGAIAYRELAKELSGGPARAGVA